MARFHLLQHEWIDVLLLPQTSGRLAALFAHLHRRGVPIDVRQSELAEAVGSCREVVNKTIREWVREGRVVSTKHGVKRSYALHPAFVDALPPRE